MPRVCVISDCLVEPYVEGARNLARGLVEGLRATAEVLAISTADTAGPGPGVHWLPTGRPLVNTQLWDQVRRFRPQVVLYVPWSSASLLGFLSAKVLALALPSTLVIMAAFQRRRYGWLARRAARWLAPHVTLCLSDATRDRLQAMGVPAARMAVGVDSSRFRPASPSQQAKVRALYGLPQGERIALHVGHMKRARNVHVLEHVARLAGWTSVLVASPATQGDAGMEDELRAAGVTVLRRALPNVAELYRAADCYVFPVTHEQECAEVPLSVLEALAAGLPVVSTRFGGLPDLLPDEPGITWVEGPADVAPAVSDGRFSRPGRASVRRLNWPRVAADVVQQCLGQPEPPTFVCVTGIDGGGKTLQAKRLARALRARYLWCRGRPCLALPLLMVGRIALGAPSLLRTPSVAKRETPDMARAEADYQSTKTRMLRKGIAGWAWRWLNLAERLVEAWVRVGLPRLLGRRTVVDRYVYDSAIDLAAARAETDPSAVWNPDGLYARLLPKPDRVICIDIDPDTAMKRKSDIPSRDYLDRRRRLYLGLAERLGWTVVEGAGAIDEVTEQIRQCLREPSA